MIRTVIMAALCAAVSSCGLTPAFAETCIASRYGIGDGYHGRRTASGERFNTHALTAAHRTRGFCGR